MCGSFSHGISDANSLGGPGLSPWTAKGAQKMSLAGLNLYFVNATSTFLEKGCSAEVFCQNTMPQVHCFRGNLSVLILARGANGSSKSPQRKPIVLI